MPFHQLRHCQIAAMRQEVEHAISAYLRESGWRSTSATPGSYWMWEKTVTNIAYYEGDERHNRTWLVPEDVAFRLQSDWDAHAYQAAHPDEFQD